MLAVIRIRGDTKMRHDFRQALSLLKLHKTNHLVLVEEKDRGQVNKVRDFVAYGPIDAQTLALVLEKRGRVPGDKRLNAQWLAHAKIKDFETLAGAILKDIVELDKRKIKPVFRLKNPRKGFGPQGKKGAVGVGGVLGNNNQAINELIRQMV